MEGDLDRVAALFCESRRLEPAGRAAFLASACPEDPAIRAEVEDLLRAHDAAAGGDDVHPFVAAFPGLLAGVLGEASGLADALPTLEGFRVLHRLAEGGMGTVYAAEQEQPRRVVALKVLRPEAMTPDGRHRFEREAEALARLDHPGIARVHLFGATTGPGAPRPFLAMELVEGRPLTAALAGTDLRHRVSVLAEVAEAVGHAHAKGVIHRDLKPDNVLVQRSGRPKVVDFGVARLVDEERARTRTTAGTVVGTLAYMSPEQARGDTAAVDTRSDVYALGVVAYEVLCGRHPLGDREGTFTEIVRRILEETPRDPAEHDRRLRGDLRSVLRTALAKEPERRYASASALAEDLRRHLRDEPILARPLTGVYQVRRFLRRHKAAAAGAGAAVLALVAGLVLSLAFARSERSQRLRADRSAAVAERALAERSIEVAAAALRDHESATAARALDEVPPALRGWEWSYLRAGTDRSAERVPFDLGLLAEARLDEAGSWLARRRDGRLYSGRAEDLATRDPRPSETGARALLGLGARVAAVVQKGTSLSLMDDRGQVLGLATLPTALGVQAAAATSDGALVAVGQDGRQSWSMLTLLDVATGKVVSRLRGTLVDTGALAFSPGRRLLAVGGGWDGTVRLVDFDRTPPQSRALAGHTGGVGSLAFSPDGARLASGSSDRSARVWDVATGESVRLAGHRGEVLALAFDPAGSRLATAASDGSVRVWHLPRGDRVEVLLGHTTPVHALAFAADGTALRTLGDDGERLWTFDGVPEVLRVHDGPEAGNEHPYVYGVDFSPDGSSLVSAGWDRTARVVDVATGEVRRTLRLEGLPVCDARWTRDGRSIVGGRHRLVRWDVGTGAEEASRAMPHGLECVEIPADGAHVLTGDAGGAVRAFRLDDLAPVVERKGDGTALFDLSVSPADGAVATISQRGRVAVFAHGPGDLRWAVAAHAAGPFGAVAFSPDGRRVASGGADRVVRLWDAATGEHLGSLEGHRDAVYALAWLPDGSRLFSGDNGGAIRVWHPDRGRLCLEMREHDSYVYRLDVSPDGTTLASASGDNTIRLWTTVPAAAREVARRAALADRASRAAGGR